MWRTSRYNFDLIQGQSLKLIFHFTDEADIPMDLTGWKTTSQLANENGKLIETCVAEISAPVDGSVTIYLPAEKTAQLPISTLIWDLALENPTGDIEKPLRGTVTVIRGATLPRSTP